MIEDNDFYTETMAKVYADQGYLEKSAEIYRYLLKREPGRQDLIEKLSEIENRIIEKKNTGNDHLVPLFNQWVDLVLKHNRLKKLQKASKMVSNLSRHSPDE
ncbi:MAG: hypothetical protein JRJ39_03745 [Deltaproteobacteria bacterium]|nr:hypothetical protein [Deltaproteobacteria bacterium]MBW1812803.1 hypothetical protein [Deltaproteobacteria bacterium]MBW1846861.1 hypothetical protein [Deltaproteobacteria bacterium]MBW2179865.1 hypothetical protein [Deltaproteobacteria bacterium]MBW2364498.1 hypothetical protein [Deltaproteobacteria bacterium]